MDNNTKKLVALIVCILLTILSALFIPFRDNQIAKNYDLSKVYSYLVTVTNVYESNGKYYETVSEDISPVTAICIGENKENAHKIGDQVFIYSLEEGADYYSFSVQELVKHETNMIRYYPLVIIPAIASIALAAMLIRDRRSEYYYDDDYYYED